MNTNNTNHRGLPQRRSIRLKGYDYAQAGLYFITICCQNRTHRFGHIKNGEMILNDAGKIAQKYWLEIPQHFPNVILHEYIIMPNHIHGIIELVGANNHSPGNTTDHITKHSPGNITQHLPNETIHYSPNNQANINSPGNTTDHIKNHDLSHNRANINSPGNTTDRIKNHDLSHDRANDYSPLRSPSKTIGSIVRGYKIGVTKWFRANTNIEIPWQRNYYEHIIRNEQSYENISKYIINNPAHWQIDKFYPK